MKTFVKLGLLGVLGVTLTASTCTGPSPNPGGGTLLEAWQDPIGSLTLPASSVSELGYGTGDDRFHRALHSSMKGQTPVITVDMGEGNKVTLDDIRQPATSLTANDPGLLRWTRRIDYSGGTVLACQDTPPESGLWAVLGLISRIVAPWVNEWAAYRDAKNYHAIVFYDGTTEIISRTKFVLRDRVDIDSLTCAQADEL